MWSQQKFDVIVVGGGPAGTTAARYAAQEGLSVLLLEKDRDIGIPVRCGEAIGDEGIRIFLEPQERWIKFHLNLWIVEDACRQPQGFPVHLSE